MTQTSDQTPKKTNTFSSDNVVVSLLPSRPAEPLVEEINVVRLEGSYFCFDAKGATQRTAPLEFKEGNKRIVIEPDPRYGQPSVLAYKVLQAVFRKITLEGKPFPATVSFSEREIGRLMGRASWGGRDSEDLTRAIRQLRRTAVTIYSVNAVGKKQKETEYDFNLFTESGIVADKEGGKLEAVVLTLHHRIIESMRRNHFIILNWDIISELPALSAAIYKRLYLHLSNLFEAKSDKRTLKFEKNYEDICREWLGGIKVWGYKAEIERQFQVHVETLKQLGFLSSFQVEKLADGTGFKLVFRPGKKFFDDYDRFYKSRNARILQFQQAADTANYQLPIELVRYFYNKLLGTTSAVSEEIINPADIEFGRNLLSEYTPEEARAFIDFGLIKTKETKFDIKLIRGLKLYLPAWHANKELRERAKIVEIERSKAAELVGLKSLYEDVRKKHFFETRDALPISTLTQITSQAEQEAEAKFGRGIAFKPAVFSGVMKRVLELHPFPDFDEWLRSQS